MAQTLPFVDEHTLHLVGDRDEVWQRLSDHVRRNLRFEPDGLLARVLGTQPPEGFSIIEEEPGSRLVLAGRHRFSSYRLTFEVGEPGAGRVPVRAITHAAFPGVTGALYRTFVIGSGGHRLAVRHLLRALTAPE